MGPDTNPHFRLFMTSEITTKLPSNLLRASFKISLDAPTGIKAKMIRFLHLIDDDELDKPVEKARLYFLLAFLHATVEERLRYVPTGWTKRYSVSLENYLW